MTQSDFQRKFSQQEFAAGSVRGIRAWKTPTLVQSRNEITRSLAASFDIPVEMLGQSDPTGRLTGQHGGDWVSGENVAECEKGALFGGVYVIRSLYSGVELSRFTDVYGPPIVPPGYAIEQIPAKGDSHSIAHPECTCGFYAYWTVDAASIGDSCNVVGVVEGYGKTVIGSKGFRSEKAKILALAPIVNRLGDVDDALQEAMRKVAEQYPDAAIFGSAREMLSEFPPDEAPEIDEPDAKGDGLSAFMRAWLAAATPSTTTATGNHIHFQAPNRNPYGGVIGQYGGISIGGNPATQITFDETAAWIGPRSRWRRFRDWWHEWVGGPLGYGWTHDRKRFVLLFGGLSVAIAANVVLAVL